MLTTDGVVTNGAGANQQGAVDTANTKVFQQAIDSQAVTLQVQAQPSTAEKRGVVQRPTTTVTKVNADQSNAVSALGTQDVGGDRPPADGTFGKTDYIAADGDTVASIAAAHGQSISDILLANPELDIDSQIDAGDNITILDSLRLANARAIAGGLSGEALATRIREELLYASSHSATPADLLPAIQSDLLRLRPGDLDFADSLGEQAAWATELWKSQGRTHNIMDALQGMADRGDSAGIKAFVLKMFGTVAASAPSADAIEGQRDILLRFGPQSALFRAAVADAETDFLVTQPQQAAQEIANVFAEKGAVEAAALLRTYTEVGTVDPLSAALILENAQGTVEQIIAALNMSDPGAGGQADVGALNRSLIFGHLSAAADSAGRSTTAGAAIENMARHINAQGYTLAGEAARAGDGITLALEMIKQSDDANTKSLIAEGLVEGIEDFKANLRASVGAFVDTGLIASDPALLWGSLLKDPEYAFNAVLDAAHEGKTAREALAEDVSRISSQGYQMMRIVTVMREYTADLEGLEDLVAAGAPPARGTDPVIETALGTTPALLEALRSANMAGIQRGAVLDPYKGLIDPSSYVLGRQSAIDVSGNPLGVGVALHTLGTEVLGVTNDAEQEAADPLDAPEEAGETGWDANEVEVLYAASTTLILTETISALLGTQLDLDDFSTEEIEALPILQDSDDLDEAGLLRAVYYDYLHSFGAWLNIFAPAQTIHDGSQSEFGKKFAPVLEAYFAQSPISWISRFADIAGSDDARRVVDINGIRFSSGSVSIIETFEREQYRVSLNDQDDSARLEAARRDYLAAAGLRSDIARILAGNSQAAPALTALSEHLQLGPGALLSWLNQQDAGWVSRFVGGLATVQPRTGENGAAVLDRSVLDSIVSIAASSGHPLPGSRLVH